MSKAHIYKLTSVTHSVFLFKPKPAVRYNCLILINYHIYIFQRAQVSWFRLLC